ncbi:hypothetical protein ACOSP7_028703 [Xanthoceras sorbifolium]|uniref:RING-type E3 ubiquitin transferase n=1 Tax=Xanthoceras sorbifolium TaxID=99658 RepID=A0ABQ8HCK3_9ROSI|nr:hypothetical protein JRO89_XS12G0134500 [Xanthoceras sorbifolium]KAH7554217.1 hypothetical protein JRO89_XS12G0135800 [Xanthoceras sorbifolium]
MKFGETFMEYLHGEQEKFLDKCSHVEYKQLKKVLRKCRTCKSLPDSYKTEQQGDNEEETDSSKLCPQSCPVCDQIFFSELMKEASGIAGCFSSRARNLQRLHVATGMQRFLLSLRRCFKDEQAMKDEGSMLIDYITMNEIAIRKILKKYDKVHCSVNGNNFKSKMKAEHIELLRSPWLIELGAFLLNFNRLDGGEFRESSGHSCDFNASQSVMTLTLANSIKLEYDLTCAICLDTVYNPYALSCGHLFCKSCACSAASIMIFEGIRTASPDSKCPVCREAGVYANAIHMLELDLLLKKSLKEYWKERTVAERAEKVKQSKEYWDLQTKYAIGL